MLLFVTGGGWLSTHEIPGDKSRIDRSFEVIGEYNSAVLQQIADDPNSGLVHKYYSSCMDTNAIEKVDTTPIYTLWNRLQDDFTDVPGTVARNLAFMMPNGFSALFGFGTDIDAYNPSSMVYVLGQGGLGLPDPSYYQDTTVYTAYVAHISKMLALAGRTFDSDREAENIAQLESKIANITVPSDELFDPFKSTNRMTWANLIRMAPNLGFDKLINILNLRSDVAVTIDAPKFYSALSSLLARTPTNTLISYFRWQILNQSAARLSARFVKQNFAFYGTVLSGTTTPSPRAKTCMTSTVTVVPELAGKLYADKAFPAASKTAAENMYDAIVSSFEINVQKLDWMDPVTLERAIAKLKQILRLIGYPEHPRTYSSYNFDAGYYANGMLASQYEFNRTLAAAGGPSDRTHWEMAASEVNAYFSPTRAVIAIPAGILQSPFFDARFPPAMNFGGIGMVTGHELTHSLDSQGRDYTGTGKLEDWWTPSTSAAFQKRVDCIIQQYSKFSPLPGYFVNGKLTQGENIADAGGLKTAHTAYVNSYPQEAFQQSVVPNLTNEQLFFVGFAQSWCSKLTPNAVKQRLLTDPHSPPRFRVNGPAMNLPAFATAFKCSATAPMNPSDRCQIW